MSDDPRARAILDADLFAPDFYCGQLVEQPSDPLEHFLQTGDAAGLDPSPYFSTTFYKARYPDWQEQGAHTAVEDMLIRIAQGEARMPHPLIDPDYYRRSYPDLGGVGADIVLHFMRHGDAEGRSAAPDFAPDFVARCYLPLGESRAFKHYVSTGRALGQLRQPLIRDHAQSRAHLSTLLQARDRAIILGAHDAQAAGVPMLTLDLARQAANRGMQPIFVLSRSGPLAADFAALGPVIVLAEGWDLNGLAQAAGHDLYAIVNSAAAAEIAEAFAPRCRTKLLIHEMPAYLRQHALIDPLQNAARAGARLEVSFPAMADDLQSDLGVLAVNRPGIVMPPLRLRDAHIVAEKVGKSAGLFIGAGHADYRKGFDLFLEIARRISATLPGAKFVWLGNLDAWATGHAREAIAEGIDLLLPGFVAEYPAWYRLADAYLLTSRQDPGPATAIHAAAMGTPVVAYGADIAMKHHIPEIGRLVDPGNTAAFVAAALLALSETPATRRKRRKHVHAAADLAAYFQRVLDWADEGAGQGSGTGWEKPN